MKKQTQTKERSSPRFGVMDAFIILLVIVAVIGVYFRYSIVEFITGASNLSEYTVSYSVNDIRYTTPDYIEIGDNVYFSDSGEKLGSFISASENMVALNAQPALKEFVTPSGEIIEVSYPDSNSRIDVKGRLVCSGKYSSAGEFLVNGSTYIAPGQYISIKTEYVSLTIRVDAIETYEANQ